MRTKPKSDLSRRSSRYGMTKSKCALTADLERRQPCQANHAAIVDTNTQMSQLRTSLSTFAAGTASAIQDLLSQIPVPPQAVVASVIT